MVLYSFKYALIRESQGVLLGFFIFRGPLTQKKYNETVKNCKNEFKQQVKTVTKAARIYETFTLSSDLVNITEGYLLAVLTNKNYIYIHI